MTPHVELSRIARDGAVVDHAGPLPDGVRQNCEMTAKYYAGAGFVPPWIGYVAVANGTVVGNGGFTGAPQDGRVEIAYYTVPALEGRGYATGTARALIAVARKADPTLLIVARTLPMTNASTAILRKLGFAHAGTVSTPDDGDVWEWHLRA